jgi:hypothetical protein
MLPNFINGGREVTFPGEDSRIIPLPQLATYDLAPEMSASALAGCIVQTINNGIHHLILVNFANGDMLGHTGKTNAIIHAVEPPDLQSYRIIQIALVKNRRVMLTTLFCCWATQVAQNWVLVVVLQKLYRPFYSPGYPKTLRNERYVHTTQRFSQ